MKSEKQGEIKTVTIKQKQKNGDVYILERKTVYDPDKQYNRVVSSRLIGKIVKGTDKVVSTRPKLSKTKIQDNNTEGLVASRQHVGMMDIIDFIGKKSKIDDGVYKNTDTGTAQKAISVARYLFATNGNTLPGIETFQLNHPLPYSYPITGDVYCDLFAKIGRDETLMQNFFKSRVEAMGGAESVAFDSSTISTYSTNQIEARKGFNKDKDGLDTIKFLTLYNVLYKMPLAFTKLSGNIPDVITQINALKQMKAIGIDTAELITDDGYYSESNIVNLLLSGYHFITMARVGLAWIYPEIDNHLNQFTSIKTACSFEPATHCVTVKLMKEFSKVRKYASKIKHESKGDKIKFTRKIYLHLYYNRARAAEEQNSFENDLMDIKERIEAGVKVEELSKSAQNKVAQYMIINRSGKVSFNEKACEEKCKYNGYFAIISDKEKDGELCLAKYRKREYIEEDFRNVKQHTDMNHIRCWTTDVLRGRMFVQFIALCYYEYMAYLLRNLKESSKKIIENKDGFYNCDEVKAESKMYSWVQKTSIFNQLRWFDTIEEVKVSSHIRKIRWATETLKTDRLYLNRLGIINY